MGAMKQIADELARAVQQWRSDKIDTNLVSVCADAGLCFKHEAAFCVADTDCVRIFFDDKAILQINNSGTVKWF